MSDEAEQVREYVDSHDLSEEIEQGQWETETAADPMVTTSLRLPKSLLDWVRAQAADQHVKPTAWIRELLERERAGQPALESRVGVLEELVAGLQQAEQARTTRRASRTKAAGTVRNATTRTRAKIAKSVHQDPANLRRVATVPAAKKKV